MPAGFTLFLLSVLLISLGQIEYAWADSLESALMPGQVIQGHAKWEETCANAISGSTRRRKLSCARTVIKTSVRISNASSTFMAY